LLILPLVKVLVAKRDSPLSLEAILMPFLFRYLTAYNDEKQLEDCELAVAESFTSLEVHEE